MLKMANVIICECYDCNGIVVMSNGLDGQGCPLCQGRLLPKDKAVLIDKYLRFNKHGKEVIN